MAKPVLLFVCFCAIIFIHISATYGPQKTATPKPAITAAPADTVKKAVAAQKSKIMAMVDKLIKPFKFRANERARIQKVITDYILKDSITAVAELKALGLQMPLLASQLKSLKQQVDSLKQIQPQVIIKPGPVIPGLPPAPVKTKDTVAKAALAPLTGKPATTVPVSTTAQQKLNILRSAIKAPLYDTIYSKDKDSVIVRKFSIKFNKEIMGFYNATATGRFDTINYKLMTTLVYAVSADTLPFSLGKNAWLIDSAKKRRINVMLSFYTTQSNATRLLLFDKNAKESLIKRSLSVLNSKKINDVNFDLANVDHQLKNDFTAFVYDVNTAYKQASKKYTVSVTLPGSDRLDGYDLPGLDQYTQYFIVDFTKPPAAPGAMSTLGGTGPYSIQSCFSAYLTKGILAHKFILGLPYYGTMWGKTTKKLINNYVSYNYIEKNYGDSTIRYNDDESAAKIETNSAKAPVLIWYDDDKTLGVKYNYVLNNKLGGVALKYIGDDNVNGELKNELLYKFGVIDTMSRASKNIFKPSFADFISHLLTSPCNHFVPPVYSTILLIINIVLIIVLAVAGSVLFYQVKQKGDTWPYKTQLIYVLITVFVVWTFMFLMWLFFWNNNPFFGPNSSHCINISFVTLFTILFAGTCIGAAIYWFYHLNRTDERP